jgi:PKD repeat protein
MPVRYRVGCMRRALLVAVTGLASLVFAGPASATMHQSGKGEPSWTRGTTNTWWFHYKSPSTRYYICFTYYENGTTYSSPTDHSQTGGFPAHSTPNCSNYLGGVNAEGDIYVSASELLDGGQESVCATEYYDSPDFPTSHQIACYGTRMDNTKPTIATSVDGTAEFTNDPKLNLTIDYADAYSPPWFARLASNDFGDQNVATAESANWACWNLGSQCVPNVNGANDHGCSVPNNRYSTSAHYACALQWSGGDGKIYFCVRAADSAVPDVTPGVGNAFRDQWANATANQANISDVNCSYVTLDRGAPTVDAQADHTTVTKGQVVNFSADASDALSGVSGGYSWSFGDNTDNDTGKNVTHTYTETGTFQAKVTTQDGAGNTGHGTVTITVKAPTDGGGGNNTGGGGSTGGHTTIAGLHVSGPKSVKAGTKTINLALTSEGAGRVSASLIRSGKILKTASKTLPGAGTFPLKIKLSKGLKKGTVKVSISWTPHGQTKATTKSLTIKVKKKK